MERISKPYIQDTRSARCCLCGGITLKYDIGPEGSITAGLPVCLRCAEYKVWAIRKLPDSDLLGEMIHAKVLLAEKVKQLEQQMAALTKVEQGQVDGPKEEPRRRGRPRKTTA